MTRALGLVTSGQEEKQHPAGETVEGSEEVEGQTSHLCRTLDER